MAKPIRPARSAVMGVALALLVAAPAAATQPTRTVHSPAPVAHYAAGEGKQYFCGIPVHVTEEGK